VSTNLHRLPKELRHNIYDFIFGRNRSELAFDVTLTTTRRSLLVPNVQGIQRFISIDRFLRMDARSYISRFNFVVHEHQHSNLNIIQILYKVANTAKLFRITKMTISQFTMQGLVNWPEPSIPPNGHSEFERLLRVSDQEVCPSLLFPSCLPWKHLSYHY
jgi:hypothetical protein